MQKKQGHSWRLLLALAAVALAIAACAGNAEQVTTTPEEAAMTNFQAVDEALRRAAEGSLAYNAPETMRLEETVDVQLLISPTTSPQALEEAITESGPVESAAISVTPWMQAELRPVNARAFEITPVHENARQLVGTVEPTEWKWAVTALEGGRQRLTLVVFRLVEFEGEESWRTVEEFTTDLEVDVTLGQRLARGGWLWLAAALLLVAGGWLAAARRDGRSASVAAEAVPGLAAADYRRLRRLLLRCGPFDDEDEWRAVFADPRIRPWRHRLPQADNAIGRVEATINLLGDAANQEGVNGLVLLLHALRDRLPEEDDCHRDLDAMAETVGRAVRPEEVE